MTGVVTMRLEKETKGAVKYQEIDDSGAPVTTSNERCAIGTLYVRKTALNGEIPQQIKVSLKW
jgi:hypothetical protein